MESYLLNCFALARKINEKTQASRDKGKRICKIIKVLLVKRKSCSVRIKELDRCCVCWHRDTREKQIHVGTKDTHFEIITKFPTFHLPFPLNQNTNHPKWTRNDFIYACSLMFSHHHDDSDYSQVLKGPRKLMHLQMYVCMRVCACVCKYTYATWAMEILQACMYWRLIFIVKGKFSICLQIFLILIWNWTENPDLERIYI